MLDIVKDRPGCSVNDVCDFFDISRIAVMKHLRMLEQAELIVSEKAGRVRKLYFNAVPIQMIYDRWTSEYSSIWAGRLTQIKYRIESVPKPQPQRATARPAPQPREKKRHA
jgi:hypothetical protein